MSENNEHTPRILVTAGSKHGATTEIAARIAQRMEEAGLACDLLEPGLVRELDRYDAVVLGSAVYAGHWTAEAKEVARLLGELSAKPHVWLFSSGPIGDPPKPEEDPVDVGDILRATSAREHMVFSGKIDKSKLSFGEKAILVAVRAPEGDFREWAEIEAWADQIADTLAPAAATQPPNIH